MKLIDRYVTEVGKHLPRSKDAKILKKNCAPHWKICLKTVLKK